MPLGSTPPEAEAESNPAPPPPFDPELECPICIKLLHKPVSTECGHTFCKTCLAESLQHRPLCPLCRHPLSWNISAGISPQVHDNKIVQRLIERHYPVESAARAVEIRESLRLADEYMRARRSEQAQTLLQNENQQHVDQHQTDNESTETEPSPEVQDCTTSAATKMYNVPLILQKAKFSLPLPGEPIELYFEGLNYTTFLASILSQGRTCIALGSASKNLLSPPPPPGTPASGDSDDAGGSGLGPTVAVLIKIHRCQKLIFPPPVQAVQARGELNLGALSSNNAENAGAAAPTSAVGEASSSSPITWTNTLVNLGRQFTLFRSPPTQTSANLHSMHEATNFPTEISDENPSRWVPQRLFDKRRRFFNNKRELDRPDAVTNAPLDAQARYILSGEALFRLKFRESDEEGGPPTSLSIVKATPFFDGPLLSAADANDDLVNHAQTVELANLVREKLLGLLQNVGSAGRIIYNRRYGQLAVVPLKPTSCQLEDLSFHFCKPVEMKSRVKHELLACESTALRFRKLLSFFDKGLAAVGLNLGLPSGERDLFSFLMFKSTWTSLLLGLILVAILVAGGISNRWSMMEPVTGTGYYRQAAKFINSAAGGVEFARLNNVGYSTFGSMFGL